MTDNEASLWWENITGPLTFIERIANLLAQGKSVVLPVDTALPWQDQMRDFVMSRLRAHLHLVEWEESCGQNKIVWQLLGKEFPRYRESCPSRYDDQISYLKEREILADSVVWILPGQGSDPDQLLRFISDYRGKSLEKNGAFVIEIPSLKLDYQLSSRVEVVRCSDYFRQGDLQLVASILAENEKAIPEELKSYAACVCTSLAGWNVELILELLQQIRFEDEDPVQGLFRLQEEGTIPCLYTRQDEEELKRQVWASQLQAVFAGIELQRIKIVGEHTEEIEKALHTEYWNPQKQQTGYICQHEDELETAFDVELGTITWMMKLRCQEDRMQYLLYFPDKEVRDWICFLKDCRNRLAHHKLCTPDQMKRLLCTFHTL